MQAAAQSRRAAQLPRGIFNMTPQLGAGDGDILIYKSIAALSTTGLLLVTAVDLYQQGSIYWPSFSIATALMASALLCWALARAGRREVAAAMLIGLAWTATTVYAFESGFGMHSALVFLYLPCVLYTALFFGLALAAAELGLTVAALIVMYVAEETGRLHGAAGFIETGKNFNFVLTVIFIAAGTLIVSYIYHRRIERDAASLAAEAEQRRLAMEQAQAAQVQLETANARLQALNAELAARMRQHTLESVRARRDLDLYHDAIAKDLPASLAALRAALESPDEGTEARLQQEIARMGSLAALLGALRDQSEPPLRHEPLLLSEMANHAAAALRARARYARVRFEVEPGMRAQADRELVTALFGHLLKRAAIACQAEPEPIVRIGSGSRDGRALYYVSDNGPALDEKAREHLFRPFSRTARPEDTVDIGIVSSRRIAERHGGELFVESEPGRGTTYFFTLAPDATA
jgi:signal transduction histidine kinase